MANFQIKHRYSDVVLFECDVPEQSSGMSARYALQRATANRVDLRGVDLSGADLRVFKTDFFDVLLRATREIPALRSALVGGKVDGSTYSGDCACLVGTIANARGTAYTDIGIKPDTSRPAEQWFMSITRGDTPESNQVSAITVEWVDEFTALLNAAMLQVGVA